MTVEQQIADMQQASVEQTQASQALADEVAGKMEEIERALIDSVSMVSALSRTYYVDGSIGSDSNVGSDVLPFKTIVKALESIPINGFAEIYVRSNQTYIHDLVTVIIGAAVTIRPWSWSGLDADRPKIIFSANQNTTHNHLSAISLKAGARLLFHSVSLDHQEKRELSLPWSNLGCMVYTGDSEGLSPVVCLHKCGVNLRQGSKCFVSAISGGELLSNGSVFAGDGTVFYANPVGVSGYLSSTFDLGITPNLGAVFSNI